VESIFLNRKPFILFYAIMVQIKHTVIPLLRIFGNKLLFAESIKTAD